MKQQGPPSDLTPRGRGRKLWRAIIAELELNEHETALLHEAARVLDRLDGLDSLARRVGLLLPDLRLAPWIVEARQQQLVLARLLASLRLPDDLALPEARPQRRGGARGAYRLRVIGGRNEISTGDD